MKTKLLIPIVRIHNSLRLSILVFLLFLNCLSVFAQPTITNSTFSDNSIWMPFSLSFSHHEVAYLRLAPLSGNELLAAVFDGSNAGIIIDDGIGGRAYQDFASLSYSPNTPTQFYNPDVTLLRGGTKAIVTFETNDATYGAYILEFDIDPILMTIIQSGSGYPIYTSLATEPKIDGSPDYSIVDRFAVTFIDQSSKDVYYEIYQYSGGSYLSLSAPYLASPTPVASSIIRLHPDIALSFDNTSNDPVVEVSYREYNANINDLFLCVDETHTSSIGAPSSQTNRLYDQVFLTTTFVPSLCGYPRIAGENGLNGLSGTTYMQCVVAASDLYNLTSGTPHLKYANIDLSGGSTIYNLDAPYNSTAAYRNEDPAVGWMLNTTDAFVAWGTNYNGGSQAVDVVGVMQPDFISYPAYNAWEKVNDNSYLPIINSTTVYSDPYNQAYLVSYKRTVSGVDDIMYKLRSMPSTGFKMNSNSLKNIAALYPNPTKDFINVDLPQEGEINIYDMYGKLCLKEHCQSKENNVNIKDLSDGVYFLKTEFPSFTFLIKK